LSQGSGLKTNNVKKPHLFQLLQGLGNPETSKGTPKPEKIIPKVPALGWVQNLCDRKGSAIKQTNKKQRIIHSKAI